MVRRREYARYFNPRSHERSDGYFAKWDLINDISIHAPTRGATRKEAERDRRFCGFQSTLPREERHQPSSAILHDLHFNPRSHERSDCDNSIENKTVGISIHAPTRGATPPTVLPTSALPFQSTLPREERLTL